MQHQQDKTGPRRRGGRNRTRISLWLALAASLAAPPQDTWASDPAPLQNAALHYWEAAASVSGPLAEADVEPYRFIDGELDAYPPPVFVVRPDVLRILLDETPLLQALSRGADAPFCRFDTGAGESPVLSLRHLPAMDRVARRALHVFLAYEYVRNDRGGVQILEHIFNLAADLDQDRNLRSALTGAGLVDRSSRLVEGYLSREPTIEAVEQLIKFFDAHPDPLFQLHETIRTRSKAFADWLREDPEQAEAKLLVLYRDSTVRPAVDQLRTLEPGYKRERLEEWLDAFTAFSAEQAESVARMYTEGLVAVRSVDERLRQVREQAPAGGANPVIALLAPPELETLYERFLLCEAQSRAMEVLTHAARYRLLVGRWPDDLDVLQTFGARSLPRDPFSQKPFHYTLRGKAPRLVIRVPRWIADAGDLAYVFELAERKETDTKRVSDYAAHRVRSRARDDEGSGQPVGR